MAHNNELNSPTSSLQLALNNIYNDGESYEIPFFTMHRFFKMKPSVTILKDMSGPHNATEKRPHLAFGTVVIIEFLVPSTQSISTPSGC